MSDDETKEPREDGREDLPEGVPEPPDLKKVHALRAKLKQDHASRGQGDFRPARRLSKKSSEQARDIGIYTIIPMMMVAGPAIGYLLGMGIQRSFGGDPWPVVIGSLFGLVAAFRQIFLLLSRKAEEDRKRKNP